MSVVCVHVCLYVCRAAFIMAWVLPKVKYAFLANGMEPGVVHWSPGVVHDAKTIGHNYVALVVLLVM